MHTPDVRAAAHALGGDIIGRDQVLCPGPGHSPRDRSLAVRFVADGFIVHSHANDDWQACRDHVSARLGWDNQQHVTKPARMRPRRSPPTILSIGSAGRDLSGAQPFPRRERWPSDILSKRDGLSFPIARRSAFTHGIGEFLPAMVCAMVHQRIHRHSSDVSNGRRQQGWGPHAGP
jgi:hypothetical protein